MMDPQKSLEKILKEKDPMKSAAWDDYASEAKILIKELQYVRSIEKIAMVLYTVFAKSYSPKDATINWKPIAEAITKDPVMGKLVGKLIK